MPGREFRLVMAAPHLNDDAQHGRLSRWPRIKLDECAEVILLRFLRLKPSKTLTAEDAECAKKIEHRVAITFSATARRHRVPASGPLQPVRTPRSLVPPACGIRFGKVAHQATPGC